MAPTATLPTPEHSAGRITGEPVIPSPTTGSSSAVSFPIYIHCASPSAGAGGVANNATANRIAEMHPLPHEQSPARHCAQAAASDAPVRRCRLTLS
jgi:hypothetical protein